MTGPVSREFPAFHSLSLEKLYLFMMVIFRPIRLGEIYFKLSYGIVIPFDSMPRPVRGNHKTIFND